MKDISSSDIEHHRAALVSRLRNIGGCPTERFHGRGIVVCAGGSRMFTNAYVLMWILRRHLLSRLPIEVWHFGPEELSPSMIALLEGLEVEVVDATARLDRRHASVRDGWQLKAYALIESRFREILLLDADQVPTRDPEEVFSWPEYEATGAVFWPDIVDLSPDNPIWSLCGAKPMQRASFETGQLLVDKTRHWTALNAALYLNEHADFFYRLVYGDKDTFLASWLFTGTKHAVVPHRPFIDERCLFQRDFSGEPVFQHRTGAKWDYSGEQQVVPGFRHFDACLEALEELKRAWSGRVYHAPSRSLRARRAEEEMARCGSFVLRRPGQPDQHIRLQPHNEVSEGRSLQVQHWFVVEIEDGLHLVLHDGSRETYSLRAHAGGVWRGKATVMPRGEAHLIPVEISAQVDAPPKGSVSLAASILRVETSASGFDDEVAQRLETTFDVLARVEPTFVDEIKDLARRVGEETPIGSFLASLSRRLAARSARRQAEPLKRSDPSIISDPTHYVWP